MVRAAVFVGAHRPLEVREIEVAAPGSGELKLRMAASGVCHSDLSVQNGTLPRTDELILGHEGAGVVEEIGEGVTEFEPGDHVAISWVPQCGECFYCRREQAYLCEVGSPPASAGTMLDGTYRVTCAGKPMPQFLSIGTFAEYAVIPQLSAIKIDPSVDLRAAALIGCGVLTGVGAALRTASIAEGDSVVVIGCGGVGLNVVQGAKLAGAGRIIAIDLAEGKLRMAEKLGATHVIRAGQDDAREVVMDLTEGRGADVAFEVIGQVATSELALTLTRHGGETVLVGAAPPDAVLALPIFRGLVRYGKTLKGCYYGSANVHRDVPFLIEAYRDGRLELDSLISRQIALDDVNEAFAVMGAADVARSVIVYQ
jgi:Zn-dependent alcohol dehydrogenase